MRAGGHDGAVEPVDEPRRRRRRSRGNLADRAQAMFLVTRIDALRAIADKEITVKFKARYALQNGNANFFRTAGVNGRLVDHDVALVEYLPDRFAGTNQRRQFRPLEFVDRCRHRHDHDAARLEILQARRKFEARGRPQFLRTGLPSRVAAGLELANPFRLNVEADGVKMLAELQRQWQAYVAETYDPDTTRLQIEHARPHHQELPA